MKEPLIAEIKHNSLDDGPGIRTVVFFKGCPLDCIWCHNPEMKTTAPQMLFDIEKCIKCGICADSCSRHAVIPDKDFPICKEKCNLCFDCSTACPSCALMPAGKQLDLSEIINALSPYRPFYSSSGGGVTLSGGEPMMFISFVSDLCQALKSRGFNILIETCGLFDIDAFLKLVIPFIDILYYDLKLYDSDRHLQFCGAGNFVILDNLSLIRRHSSKNSVKVIPRLPLVPGITAAEDNLKDISDFLKSIGLNRIMLLDYNPTWVKKLSHLGIDPPPEICKYGLDKWMSKEETVHCHSFFSSFDVMSFNSY